MRTTLYDIRYRTRIPHVLGLPRNDSRVADFVNEATQLLLHRGRFWGTYARYMICATNSCLTLPRQLDTIERAAISHAPVPVHDMWFEFLANGWGTADSVGCSACGGSFGCGCGGGMDYRGNFCTFDDVRGTNKELNLICDLASDVGKEVLVLGYDENGNWIRTDQGGTIKDGELVALAQSTGTNTAKKFSCVTDLQPPSDLDGQWWLYEYDTDTTLKRMIGQYQYDEIRPSYPRYIVSGVQCQSTDDEEGTCNKTLVEVIAKLAFIPVKNDTDYLVIGNTLAMKEACMSVKYAEMPSDIQKSEACLARAIREMDLELDHHLGAGRKIGINVEGATQGYNPVPAFM